MATRIILRFSLNADANSVVRNHLAQVVLGPAGFNNTGTGTWEIGGNPVPSAAVRAAGHAVSVLSEPTGVQGADPAVVTDHVWLYVD